MITTIIVAWLTGILTGWFLRDIRRIYLARKTIENTDASIVEYVEQQRIKDVPEGENPAPGKWVRCVLRTGLVVEGESETMQWTHLGNTDDVMAFEVLKR